MKNVTAPPPPLETDMLFVASKADDKYEIEIVLRGNDIAKKARIRVL